MVLRYSIAARNAQQDALATYAGNLGSLQIYDGIVPATATTTLSGNTLLGTLTMGSTAWQASLNGTLTANSITPDSVADATTPTGATFFRLIRASDSAVVMQGSITLTGSGGDMTLNTVNIVAGGPISCTGFAITRGNA